LVAEVAAVLRRTEATVRDYLRLGSLIGCRVRCHWRVYEADLDAFLFAKATGSPGAASTTLHIPLLDLSTATGSAAASSGPTKAIPIFLEGKTLKP
jgi:excisionase family DNA binding protein